MPCHHLVFSQETIEWQIWIDASDQPLPRKLVITYVHEPGEPQYSATIRRWRLDPKFPEELFTFEAPEGAQKIDAEGDEAARGRRQAGRGSRPGRWTMKRNEDGRAGDARERGGCLDLDARPARGARLRAAGRGGGSRGSVRSVNRNPSGTGGSWSGARSSGTTQRTTSGNTSSRSTTAQTRSGETVNGNRNVTKSGDEVTVNRNVQSTSGASKSSQKTYEMDDGRVESVERDTQATSRSGQTAS